MDDEQGRYDFLDRGCPARASTARLVPEALVTGDMPE